MTDYDSPWKEILDRYFPEFMAFFFPDAYADIDGSRGHESLEAERQKIVRDAELGRRLADKLMKVWRRDGDEPIVLIHTEIQGQHERAFDQRMYVYHYRLFDGYERPVVSLAVLSDPSPSWRPSGYRFSLWGCQIEFTFPVVKLRDYEARWAEWEQSDNPFATVVMAHWRSQSTRQDPERRLQWKLRRMRRLYERGYQRQDILELFRFIDWVMELPQGLESRFWVELKPLETERNMPYITSVERAGIEKGLQQGLQQGEVLLIKKQLVWRFGELPNWVTERLANANPQQLERWANKLLDAQHLDDIFEEQ